MEHVVHIMAPFSPMLVVLVVVSLVRGAAPDAGHCDGADCGGDRSLAAYGGQVGPAECTAARREGDVSVMMACAQQSLSKPAYFGVALALQKRNKLDECMTWMERGLSLSGPNAVVLLDAAAVVSERVGDRDVTGPRSTRPQHIPITPWPAPVLGHRRATATAHYVRAIELTEAGIEAVLGLHRPGQWASLLLGCSRGDPTEAVAALAAAPSREARAAVTAAMSRLKTLYLVKLPDLQVLGPLVGRCYGLQVLLHAVDPGADPLPWYKLAAKAGLLDEVSAITTASRHGIFTGLWDDPAAILQHVSALGVATPDIGVKARRAGFEALFTQLRSVEMYMSRWVVSSTSDAGLAWLGVSCGIPRGSGITQLTGVAHGVSARQVRDHLDDCMAHQSVVASLFRDGGDLQFQRHQGGAAALHVAAAYGSARLIDAVLGSGSSSEGSAQGAWMPDGSVPTPLHIAATAGHADATAALRRHNVAAVEARDLWNRTALDIAVLQGWPRHKLADAFGDGAANAAQRNSWAAHGDPGHINGGGVGGIDCGFDVREVLTADEFAADYLAVHRPVLIRGGQVGPAWDALREKWAWSNLARAYPAVSFTTGLVPYADEFGLPISNTATTFADYLEYMAGRGPPGPPGTPRDPERDATEGTGAPQYVFSSGRSHKGASAGDFRALVADMVIPDVLPRTLAGHAIERDAQGPQFYLGPRGSGAPVHFHFHAINVLVAGSKHWFILPPADAVYSKDHIADWVAHELPKVRARGAVVLECEQRAGDLLYVPAFWAHGVLNEEQSIGYAVEFSWAYTQHNRV